jgi:DNA-binding transcriptional MerR regulator
MLVLVRNERNNYTASQREPMAQTYSPAAFRQASGLAARTIHDWVRRKLLPKPLGRGRGVHYGPRHLAAARVIRHLRESGESMHAIRARIAGLSEEQLLALLPKPAAAPDGGGVGAPAASSAGVGATGYPAKTLEVVELMDGLLLMVNLERGGLVRRVAEDIYRHYGVRR